MSSAPALGPVRQLATASSSACWAAFNPPSARKRAALEFLATLAVRLAAADEVSMTESAADTATITNTTASMAQPERGAPRGLQRNDFMTDLLLVAQADRGLDGMAVEPAIRARQAEPQA